MTKKTDTQHIIREAKPNEYQKIGELMVTTYSQLKDFPNQQEIPEYYKMLTNIGELTKKPKARLLVCVSSTNDIMGGVVYFGDMQYYGSGGSATKEKQAAGFRLLAVSHDFRKRGIGRLLTKACIEIGKTEKQKQIIIHSTKAMQIAWDMYEKMGFTRSEDLDFTVDNLIVFGFRLYL
ncbi:GNAT family N-acetyltransferase [Aquimarina sp. AD10]|uniref:Acetyltransferase n=1 Tax=Aquimarina aggregata TaxID=1642818 RepID=A0A162XT86_9FLAO|nr:MULTISPECIES: GNAT family N-acetyltransferase [Aquimarina]AXT60325.1 GNAT family N-acetyltransferase [Aquimarina sp. AD10]KZS38763.1 acetyltransferase [Aquimarina aggregata]RKN01241.1 GNAT family N-acetyltransferase [Aquimarina sp. AD10]